MNKYTIFTHGEKGRVEVEAQTRRHAVAIAVARLKLSEAEAVQVTRWKVQEDTRKCGS